MRAPSLPARGTCLLVQVAQRQVEAHDPHRTPFRGALLQLCRCGPACLHACPPPCLPPSTGMPACFLQLACLQLLHASWRGHRLGRIPGIPLPGLQEEAAVLRDVAVIWQELQYGERGSTMGQSYNYPVAG